MVVEKHLRPTTFNLPIVFVSGDGLGKSNLYEWGKDRHATTTVLKLKSSFS